MNSRPSAVFAETLLLPSHNNNNNNNNNNTHYCHNNHRSHPDSNAHAHVHTLTPAATDERSSLGKRTRSGLPSQHSSEYSSDQDDWRFCSASTSRNTTPTAEHYYPRHATCASSSSSSSAQASAVSVSPPVMSIHCRRDAPSHSMDVWGWFVDAD